MSEQAQPVARPTTRLDYIDFLNILACFSVICLHCSGYIFTYTPNRLWYTALFVQSVFHFAVPVFFMISGATLLEYRQKYNTKTFFKKRLLRTGIPFLFWSVYTMLSPVIFSGAPFPQPLQMLQALLNNGAANIYWFFYAIFGIYLSMPIFSLIAKPENTRTIQYLCVLTFVVNGLLRQFSAFVYPISTHFVVPAVAGYTGYVFLGWLIRHETYSCRTRIVIYIAGVVSIFVMFFGTIWVSDRAQSTQVTVMEYDSPACFMLSMAVMLAVKHFPWHKVNRILPQKLVREMAGLSLGIYVVHILLLNRLDGLMPFFGVHPIYRMAFMPLILYTLAALLVFILSKIPVIKRIVP